jgi:lysophospholipase L1-like esterase
MRNFALGILSILIAVVILAAGAEVALRVYHLLAGYVGPQKVMGVITLDEELGWLPTANYAFSGELVDGEGNPYDVHIQTDSAGYRLFGDPLTTRRKKVLFIGDSFTQAMHVSDDKTYPALLAEALDIEVFSFGVEGYGTLQEYMLLERIIDDVNPDVVVLQFCPNDFINNSYDLELRAIENNNRLRRPYFTEDGITYRTPSSHQAIREFAANYSKFLYWILSRIDMLRASPAAAASAESSETLIEKEGMAYPYFQRAVHVTELLLKKIRMRVPDAVPVYLFSTHHGEPYYEQIERIADSAGVIFIDGPPQAVTAAQRQGIPTLAADKGHWSNGGHQIVADALQCYFLETGQFKRRDNIPAP